MKQIDTKIVIIKVKGAFSTAAERAMPITLPRMPWEAKDEAREVA